MINVLQNRDRAKDFNEKIAQILAKQSKISNESSMIKETSYPTKREQKPATFGPSRTLNAPKITSQELFK